jgi:hypothetical protein
VGRQPSDAPYRAGVPVKFLPVQDSISHWAVVKEMVLKARRAAKRRMILDLLAMSGIRHEAELTSAGRF